MLAKKLLSNYPTPDTPFPTYTERASALLDLAGRNVACYPPRLLSSLHHERERGTRGNVLFA